MEQRLNRPRFLHWLLAGVLAASSGCLSCFHPVPNTPYEQVLACKGQLKSSRDHVYVFMVHGNDPFNYSNLTGVRDYVQSLGYDKTYFCQFYQPGWLKEMIQGIHKEDPNAHFVLVGYSLGGSTIHHVAKKLLDENIYIDDLIYLDWRSWFSSDPQNQPENVGRLINIFTANGENVLGAENLRILDAGHFAAPTNPKVLAVLARELALITASGANVDPPSPPMQIVAPDEPTPRPLTYRLPSKLDGWDFLKPTARLGLGRKKQIPVPPELDPSELKVMSGP